MFKHLWDIFRNVCGRAWAKTKVTVEKDIDQDGVLRIHFYDQDGDPEENVLRFFSEAATAAGLAFGVNAAGVHNNPDAVAGKVPVNAAGDACYSAGPGNFPNQNHHGTLQFDIAPAAGNPNANAAHTPAGWVKITQGYLRLNGPAFGNAGAHRDQIYSRRKHASYTRTATANFEALSKIFEPKFWMELKAEWEAYIANAKWEINDMDVPQFIEWLFNVYMKQGNNEAQLQLAQFEKATCEFGASCATIYAKIQECLANLEKLHQKLAPVLIFKKFDLLFTLAGWNSDTMRVKWVEFKNENADAILNGTFTGEMLQTMCLKMDKYIKDNKLPPIKPKASEIEAVLLESVSAFRSLSCFGCGEDGHPVSQCPFSAKSKQANPKHILTTLTDRKGKPYMIALCKELFDLVPKSSVNSVREDNPPTRKNRKKKKKNKSGGGAKRATNEGAELKKDCPWAKCQEALSHCNHTDAPDGECRAICAIHFRKALKEGKSRSEAERIARACKGKLEDPKCIGGASAKKCRGLVHEGHFGMGWFRSIRPGDESLDHHSFPETISVAYTSGNNGEIVEQPVHSDFGMTTLAAGDDINDRCCNIRERRALHANGSAPNAWTERPNIRTVDQERILTALRASKNPKDRGISIEQAERDYQRRYAEMLARSIDFNKELQVNGNEITDEQALRIGIMWSNRSFHALTQETEVGQNMRRWANCMRQLPLDDRRRIAFFSTYTGHSHASPEGHQHEYDESIDETLVGTAVQDE